MTSAICIVKYPYRDMPVLIQDEEQTIKTNIPYSISLLEKPSQDYAISIPDYTESDCAPSVATDFYVDYIASVIYFFSTEAGKAIQVTYYGTGSPIIANDINRFSSFLEDLKTTFFSFLVEALSGCRVRLYGGNFVDSVTGDTINTKKELFLDFGPNGNYELCSLSGGYSKKILIGIDISTLQVVIVEGTEAPRYEAALIPSYSSSFKPVACITVTENNGTILDIAQADIIPVQNFLI